MSVWKVCRLRILASFPGSPALEREHDNCGEPGIFSHVSVVKGRTVVERV